MIYKFAKELSSKLYNLTQSLISLSENLLVSDYVKHTNTKVLECGENVNAKKKRWLDCFDHSCT